MKKITKKSPSVQTCIHTHIHTLPFQQQHPVFCRSSASSAAGRSPGRPPRSPISAEWEDVGDARSVAKGSPRRGLGIPVLSSSCRASACKFVCRVCRACHSGRGHDGRACRYMHVCGRGRGSVMHTLYIVVVTSFVPIRATFDVQSRWEGITRTRVPTPYRSRSRSRDRDGDIR